MNKYEAPVVVVNDELAEGVYAGSGTQSSTDCWTVNPVPVQELDGSGSKVFEIHCAHNMAAEHISSSTTVVLTFSSNLVSARSEFDTQVSGNTVTITRTLLADAYKSGDNMTYKVWVSTGDEVTTRALSCTGATITCVHETNVQGKLD